MDGVGCVSCDDGFKLTDGECVESSVGAIALSFGLLLLSALMSLVI